VLFSVTALEGFTLYSFPSLFSLSRRFPRERRLSCGRVAGGFSLQSRLFAVEFSRHAQEGSCSKKFRVFPYYPSPPSARSCLPSDEGAPPFFQSLRGCTSFAGTSGHRAVFSQRVLGFTSARLVSQSGTVWTSFFFMREFYEGFLRKRPAIWSVGLPWLRPAFFHAEAGFPGEAVRSCSPSLFFPSVVDNRKAPFSLSQRRIPLFHLCTKRLFREFKLEVRTPLTALISSLPSWDFYLRVRRGAH